jgi:hypothetical protein
MNAPLNPALLAPVVQTFAVKIVFTAGPDYKVSVRTDSEWNAKRLAQIDARMARFDEPIKSITAERPP